MLALCQRQVFWGLPVFFEIEVCFLSSQSSIKEYIDALQVLFFTSILRFKYLDLFLLDNSMSAFFCFIPFKIMLKETMKFIGKCVLSLIVREEIGRYFEINHALIISK